jgi:transposase
VDFRCGVDGLSAQIVSNTQSNPQTGIYLFLNKGKDKVKCLSWHKNGFVLIYKRLEVGNFSFEFNKEQGAIEIKAEELGWLLAGLEWQKMRNWSELSYEKFD